MCTAFAITEENSVELAWLIEAHHEAFVGRKELHLKCTSWYTLPPS